MEPRERLMKKRNLPLFKGIRYWFESANNAIEGIMHAARTQKHLKFHLFASFFILLFCFLIGLDKYDFVIISIITLLMISAEMFNTAIESTVDLLEPEYSPLARIAKDVAAGAVFVLAVGAVIVGYLILWPYLQEIMLTGIRIHKHFPENIAILSLVINLLLIILLKSYTGKGLPLYGGFPSGHSALVFSLWISLLYLTTRLEWIIGGFTAALFISISRRFRGIHTWKEVLFGAVIGATVTYLLFYIFY